MAAHFGGLLARRIGQPAVIGQLGAGVLLGPTVLGGSSASLFTHDTTSAVRRPGHDRARCLRLHPGSKAGPRPAPGDAAACARRGNGVRRAVRGRAGRRLRPLRRPSQRRGRHDRTASVRALHVGAAVSITAFPVLARIIDDHGLRHTRVGALAVSCAAVNDVLSWVALAVALLPGLLTRPRAREAVGGAAIGLVAVLALLAHVSPTGVPSPNRPWSVLAIPAGLAGAAFATSAMGLHYIFGAFAFGLVAARASLAQVAAWPVRACSLVATILLPLYHSSRRDDRLPATRPPRRRRGAS